MAGVPAQLPILVAAAVAFLGVAAPHESSAGAVRDRLLAGGGAARRHSGRAAADAGLCPVGTVPPALAAIIYVAHLGQAKADAGTGYELTAITAVVLGGTSIFGGRGTILAARCWDCSPSPSCRTGCGWPTCRRSWPGILTGCSVAGGDRIGRGSALPRCPYDYKRLVRPVADEEFT